MTRIQQIFADALNGEARTTSPVWQRIAISMDRLDNLIRRAVVMMWMGFALVVGCQFVDSGALTAIHLIGLGAALGSIAAYKTERGIWMLALLFGVFFLVTAMLAEMCALRDFLRGAPNLHWMEVVDFAVALQLQWLLVRALLSVFVYNRRLAT